MKLLLLTIILSSNTQLPVKKSLTGRCYDVNYSIAYDKIRFYTPYKTLEECIKSGGKKAKAVIV